MNHAKGLLAYAASMNAARTALSPSPLDARMVARAVGKEALLRAAQADALKPQPKAMQLKKPSNLGCWVDGKPRFQSRDHDAVRGYAEKEMNNKRNGSVWLAPVGSFVDDKTFTEKYPDHA